MHAELIEDVAGVVEHVHDMRNRRTLVAAHIGNARLEQRLRYGKDRLAVEGFAFAELELLYFLLERSFHYTSTLGSQTATAGMKKTSARSKRLITI